MDQKEITQLFRKYLDEQLSHEEIVRLKILVREMDEDSFTHNLRELWDAHCVSSEQGDDAFHDISRNLREIIQPQRRTLQPTLLFRIAAAAIILLLLTSTTYLYMERKERQTCLTQECKISAGKGERASITLPDGTNVYLNAESSLSYPASFALDSRMVHLTGEAYFEVKHNAKAPFVVQTPKVKVKVLGTTFNLYAHPDDFWFEAALVEGRIEVTPCRSPEKTVCLAPNQKARYNDQTGEINVAKTDLRVETAWKRGDLLFRNESFDVILRQLELFYGVCFHIEGVYPEALFTGSFHESDITQVLRNLQQHYLFTYRKSGNEVYIAFN